MGKSISEIKKEFENSDENSWEKLCGFMSRIPGSVCRIWRHVTAKSRRHLCRNENG